MPIDVTEKYIRIRQKNPDDFVDNSFRIIDISQDKGIKAVIAKLKSDPEGSTIIQSYLFEKDKWSLEEAKKWVSDHKEKKSDQSLIEHRSFDFSFDVESRDDKQQTLTGHAAVFNTYSDMGWFQERILPGAFTKTIKSDDVRALFNHNPNYVLGRNKAGTLLLSEDAEGLAVRIIPPDTQFARDLLISINRGDISQMSFAFRTIGEEWEKGENGNPDSRSLVEAKLYDVSPVTYPAYPQTSIAVRSFQNWKESHKEPVLSWEIKSKRRRLDLQLKGR